MIRSVLCICSLAFSVVLETQMPVDQMSGLIPNGHSKANIDSASLGYRPFLYVSLGLV